MARSARGNAIESSAWEAVIGLEVHVQLRTRTKMFCRCEARFGAEPNSLVCPVCLGLPGALPVINRRAVEHTVRVGLAFGSRIPELTKFDRKSYYYPDLPKGYQISQNEDPICDGGVVDFLLGDEPRRVRLVRIHLEEDAGKNIHEAGSAESLVDLNRAGTPLMEIVSRPDLRTPREAAEYMRTLRDVVRFLGVSDGNMEEGSLRCDSNISIRPRGSEELETRAEIKNLNSFTFVEKALEHEIVRQIRVRETGGVIVQETRLYDPERDETRPMRGKEEAHDYRYFPEPDLAPLTFDAAWVEEVRRSLPELPLSRRRRYREELGLETPVAARLAGERATAEFFERCVALLARPRPIANWIVNALREELGARDATLEELDLTPERFVELIEAVEGGVVSGRKGKEVLREMLSRGASAGDLIRELGLEQISDEGELRAVVEAVIAAHPGPVEDVRRGKKNSVNFLVGQVMRQSGGKANPAKAAELIRALVGEG